MKFSVLGPLEVVRGDRTVPLRAAKQRIALATLLLHANQHVSSIQLIERMWDGSAPADARGALQTHFARLRRALDDGRNGQRLINTRDLGYVIEVDPDSLDLMRFRDLTARAARVAETGDNAEEADLLLRALALWRGPVLANVPSESLHREHVPQLIEDRLQALVRWFDLELLLGRHDQIVADLKTVTAAHPLRERLWAQLMLSLYRSGRQAEALEAYQAITRVLREELGIEPGKELRHLHQAILVGDAELARPPRQADAVVQPYRTLLLPAVDTGLGDGGEVVIEHPEPAAPAERTQAAVRPQQLPSDIARFTGRFADLATLERLLPAEGDQAPQPIVIAAVGGAGGVGKTTLAVHWAHRVRDRFPDGQLYLNLHGFGPGAPMEPIAALETLLRALGVATEHIPSDLEGRSALLRTVLAGQRVLMLLDNARDAAQVRPLLPGSQCLVLITSRSRLRGLVARDGARGITLDQLTPAESITLLSKVLGSERIAAERDAAAELARLCAHLPLALAIAAEHAGHVPDVPLTDLVEQLRDERTRLDVLNTTDDPEASVRTVFSWSYQALDPAAARMFRLLGLHPGDDIGAPAAAALAGISTGQARRLLNHLADAHQLQQRRPGRYEFHDLLRAYATEMSHQDAEAERAAAIRRVLDWYLQTAINARTLLDPGRPTRDLISSDITPLTFDNDVQAFAWYDAERVNLVTAIRHAADHGLHSHAWELTNATWLYFETRHAWDDYLTTHHIALASARRAGDRYAQAQALDALGNVYVRIKKLDTAFAHVQHAYEIFCDLGDRAGESLALIHIGAIHYFQRRLDEAAHYGQRALVIAREIADPFCEMFALHGLGAIYTRLHRYQEAVDTLRKALDIQRGLGHLVIKAPVLDSLGDAFTGVGDYDTAITYYRQALALNREYGNRRAEALNLTNLGRAQRESGRIAEARQTWEEALAVLEDLRSPEAAQVHSRLAELDAGRSRR